MKFATKWMLFIPFGMIISILLIVIVQAIKKKRITKQTVIVAIVLLFELMIIVLQYIAILISDNRMKFLSDFIWWVLMVIISIMGHCLVQSPQLPKPIIRTIYTKHKFIMNTIWILVCIVNFISVIGCFVFHILTENPFWQDVYMVVIYLYILMGAVIILITSCKIYTNIKHLQMTDSNNNKFQITIENIEGVSQNSPESNVIDTDHHSSSNGESNTLMKPVPQHPDSISNAYAITLDNPLEKAKHKINNIIITSILIIILLLITCIWYTIRLIYLYYLPFNYTFITHYFFVCLLSIISIIHELKCKETHNMTSNSSKTLATERRTSMGLKVQTKVPTTPPETPLPMTPQPIVVTMEPIKKEEEIFAIDKNEIETPTQMHRTSMWNTPTNGTPTNGNNTNESMNKDYYKSPQISYANTPTNAPPTEEENGLRLSHEKLNLDLQKLTYSGQTIGKRGKKKLQRLNANELAAIRESVSAVALNKELHAFNTEIRAINKPKFTTNISQSTSFAALNNALNTIDMSDDEFDDNIDVKIIVFEFGNVICTQWNKLENKSQAIINSQTLMQKQIYFGGIDRIKMLNEFFDKLDENIQSFAISDMECKKLMKLLKDVELLKNFVSVNPNNPSKLIGNLIGANHIYYKHCWGKTHLILLKLLENLSLSHDELLYVGNNKQIIQHLKSIKICKTYTVESNGLTQDDVHTIQHLYF